MFKTVTLITACIGGVLTTAAPYSIGFSGQSSMSSHGSNSNAITIPPGAENSSDDWIKFINARQPDNLYAWATDKDHEDAGIETQGGGPWRGVRADHALFSLTKVDFQPPPNSKGTQTLFAPTTRPPNGACLEMGTAYTAKTGKDPVAYVYVFDFCRYPRAFIYKAVVDQAFLDTYARGTISGERSYSVSISTSESDISPNTLWSAQLYNYKTSAWETLRKASGLVTSDYRGWSIFETWYQAGQCPSSIPSLAAGNIKYYNIRSQSWVPVVDNMDRLQNSLHAGGNCFQKDLHGLASYIVTKPADNAWRVTGTGH